MVFLILLLRFKFARKLLLLMLLLIPLMVILLLLLLLLLLLMLLLMLLNYDGRTSDSTRLLFKASSGSSNGFHGFSWLPVEASS